MEEEFSLDAKENLRFKNFVLDVYKRDLSNVVALIGDNNWTNNLFENLAGKPLVVCELHRLIITVQDLLDEHEEKKL